MTTRSHMLIETHSHTFKNEIRVTRTRINTRTQKRARTRMHAHTREINGTHDTHDDTLATRDLADLDADSRLLSHTLDSY